MFFMQELKSVSILLGSVLIGLFIYAIDKCRENIGVSYSDDQIYFTVPVPDTSDTSATRV